MQETQVWTLGWGRLPWRRAWQPTPVVLPGEFRGQRSLAGYSPWGCKESDTTGWLTLWPHMGQVWPLGMAVYFWCHLLFSWSENNFSCAWAWLWDDWRPAVLTIDESDFIAESTDWGVSCLLKEGLQCTLRFLHLPAAVVPCLPGSAARNSEARYQAMFPRSFVTP